MLRMDATKKNPIAAVAIQRMIVIRVIAKCTPNRSKVDQRLGEELEHARRAEAGISGGHSEARTTLALTGLPSHSVLLWSCAPLLRAGHPAFPYLTTTK